MKLIVINPTGCTDTIVKVNTVTIGSVKADFTSPAIICEGTPFT